LAFSSDLLWLAAGSVVGIVRLYRTSEEKTVELSGKHQGPVRSVLFSPDSQYLMTTSDDGVAQTWDIRSERPLGFIKQSGAISEGCFSKDGRRLATASAGGTARVWDVQTGEALSPPLFHGGPVHTVDFSPDGRSLLTSSDDGTVRLWELPREDDSLNRILALTLLLGGQRSPSAPEVSLPAAWTLISGQPAEKVPFKYAAFGSDAEAEQASRLAPAPAGMSMMFKFILTHTRHFLRIS
jgi:WD40 repeat protein